MDGLGGGYSSVSKVAVLDDENQPKGDVNYLFGQVSVTAKTIDWSGSCGNLCAAVAAWAIEEGLVSAPEEPSTTTVEVWNANHGKMIEAHVPTSQGAPEVDGFFSIDGVAHPGSEIRLEFLDPGGGGSSPDGIGGSVLPTGHPKELIAWQGREYSVTLVNAGNPTVIVDAEALGLDATENANRIHQDPDLLDTLEGLRCLGAVRMGIGDPEVVALKKQLPMLPLIHPACIGISLTYDCTAGSLLSCFGRIRTRSPRPIQQPQRLLGYPRVMMGPRKGPP